MLNKDLINTSLPALSLRDTVHHALQMMDDFNVVHIPVIDQNTFVGTVSEEDLLNAPDESMPLSAIQSFFSYITVPAQSHFQHALQICNEYGLTIIPVVEAENSWVGAISSLDLLKFTSHFLGADEPGGIIVLEMEKRNFSFSEISKLVETNDAQITQVNTNFNNELGVLLVTLKINKQELSDIVATFQRYEYVIRYYFGEEHYENELRNNYDHLMNYLNI